MDVFLRDLDLLRQRVAGLGEPRRGRAQATLVDGESALDEQLLNGHETIGLTAGASTPEELVRATAARLAEAGYALPEEIEVAKEDVHFRLPKEVAQA